MNKRSSTISVIILLLLLLFGSCDSKEEPEYEGETVPIHVNDEIIYFQKLR